jgi:hypothetical protein
MCIYIDIIPRGLGHNQRMLHLQRLRLPPASQQRLFEAHRRARSAAHRAATRRAQTQRGMYQHLQTTPHSAHPPRLPNRKAVEPTSDASLPNRVAPCSEQNLRHPKAEASASTAQCLAKSNTRAPNVLGTDSKVPGADSTVLGTAGNRWTATTDLRPRSPDLKSTTAILGECGFSWRAPRPSARAATHPTRHASIWNNPFSFPQQLPDKLGDSGRGRISRGRDMDLCSLVIHVS